MITKESILDAAQSLVFSEKKEAVSLRKIAAVVGCAPPSIYYYFKNKAAIMQGLGERFMQQALASMNDTYKQLAYQEYGNYWLDNPRQFALLMMDNDHKVDLNEFSDFTQIKLQLSADEQQATALVCACHGLVLHCIQHHLDQTQSQALLQQQLSLINFS